MLARRTWLAPVLILALAAGAVAQAKPHHGLDPANLDTTCAPCTDFYRFANGGWIKRTTLPPAFSNWGSFAELTDRNDSTLQRILVRLAATAPANPTTNDQKLGAFYASCMDTVEAENAGVTPLKDELDRIRSINSTGDVIAAIARLHQSGTGALFGFGGTPDFKNSSQYIAGATQGGLGLPDRDYYTRTDSAGTAVRGAYATYVTETFRLLGDAIPDSATDHVMLIETALAKASLTRVQRRDPNSNYHKMTLAQADSITPHLEWGAFLKAAGTPVTDTINIGQPSFFRSMDSVLVNAPVAAWRDYLRWHLVRQAAPWLSSPYVLNNFRYVQAVSGVKEQQPRWKRCVGAANGLLGDALGQAYVHEAFTPAARARALVMVNNLVAALDARLHTLEWMSDTTRQQALIKLRAFSKKIGYPDTWRDYAGLTIDKGPFIANAERAQTFAAARNFGRIGKAVDRTEFRMTPPTVNAQYSPTWNDITFPAGILQPPFFDPQADDAVNYGGMGAVIGHEMTHGFDDQGRQFDAQGNLRDWWTPDDATRFKARAQRVVDQFDSYTVVDSATHVQGRLTLGEDIADLGGLKVAYAAFQMSLKGKPRPPKIDGYTPEQRFFLAWAQIWRSKATDQSLRNQVVTDPHAPAVWRVMGPLSNLPEFAAAFRCKAGDVMVRADSLRAEIW
jgi:putative endopeptidase